MGTMKDAKLFGSILVGAQDKARGSARSKQKKEMQAITLDASRWRLV